MLLSAANLVLRAGLPMAPADLLAHALLVTSFVALILMWSIGFAERWPKALPQGRWISWLVMLAYLLARHFKFETRSKSTLLESGLSLSNMLEVSITFVAAIWAVYLIVAKGTKISSLLAGPCFWITSLIILYMFSTLWSIWPSLTIFRAAQLGVFWVIAVHIFARPDGITQLERFLWIFIAVQVVRVLITQALPDIPSEAGLSEALQLRHLTIHSPTRGFAAGVLLILLLHAVRQQPTALVHWKFAVAAAAFIAFSSMTAYVALVCALAVYALNVLQQPRKLLAIVISLGAMSAVLLVLAFEASNPFSALLDELSSVTGRTPESIVSLTGRIPLWMAIWDTFRSELFGSGFAAAEKMVLSADREGFCALATWCASDAHNGFLSAWLGAGWAGFLLVLLIFVSVWLRSTRLPPQVRALTSSLIVMLFISQMGSSSVGAVFNPAFVVMMAIACIPGELALAPTSSEGDSDELPDTTHDPTLSRTAS